MRAACQPTAALRSSAPSCSNLRLRAQRACLPAAAAPRPAAAGRQQRHLCRAAADKEGQGQSGSTQQEAGKPVVPDTPPTPASSAAQQEQPASAASGQVQPTTMSVEEIQQRAAALRQQQAAAAAGSKESFLQGVSEEVGLIKWPAPGKAAVNTVLVIGIVAGTAATLLAINGLLTNISDVIY